MRKSGEIMTSGMRRTFLALLLGLIMSIGGSSIAFADQSAEVSKPKSCADKPKNPNCIPQTYTRTASVEFPPGTSGEVVVFCDSAQDTVDSYTLTASPDVPMAYSGNTGTTWWVRVMANQVPPYPTESVTVTLIVTCVAGGPSA